MHTVTLMFGGGTSYTTDAMSDKETITFLANASNEALSDTAVWSRFRSIVVAMHTTDIAENEEGETVVTCETENEVIARIPGSLEDNWAEALQAAQDHETDTLK